MRRKNVWFVAALAICLCAARAPAADATASPQDVAAIADGNNAFALDLYAQLAKTNSGNLFFSPYSVRTALAMTYAGARGETAEQMRKVLHFSLPDDRLHAAFAALAADLNNGATVDGQPAYVLTIANALWGQSGFAYNPVFLQLLRQNYGAEFQQANFMSAADQARQDINHWVKTSTHNKINESFSPGALDVLTRLVLVDAVYFKGQWDKKFDTTSERHGPFNLGEINAVQVSMMYQEARVPALENNELQMVELPYRGNALSMMILLPPKVDGLPQLEEILTTRNLDGWTRELANIPVEVNIPKLKLDIPLDLVDDLQKLGLPDAFSEGADFSGICAHPVMIQHLMHQSFVDVNEEGTEAAATTGVGLRIYVFHPTERMIFRANHPFVFIIRQVQSGTILFMGRVTNPNG
jgi:serpin B